MPMTASHRVETTGDVKEQNCWLFAEIFSSNVNFFFLLRAVVAGILKRE